MEKTIVRQNNTEIRISSEAVAYKIETSVISAGELPGIHIFVYTIQDPADPSQDVFARVAVVGDLDGTAALNSSRDASVASASSEFLASYFSLQYDDLTIATQALAMISSRITELINNWILYRDQFVVNNGVDQYFPTTDPVVEQALTDIYVSARDARIAATEALALASTDVTLAQNDAANAQAVYLIYENEKAFCSKTHQTDWYTLDAALTGILTAGTLFSSTSKTQYCALASVALSDAVIWPPTTLQQAALSVLSGGASWTAWYNAIQAFDSAQNTYNTTGAPTRIAVGLGLLAFCQAATANDSYAYNNKMSADSLVADAVVTKKEAEATWATAQKAEDAALANLRAVCPTFDPSTV